MRKRKQGLSLAGLLVVVALGVMAFASSAQALVPKFFVGGTLAAAGLNAPVEAKQVGRGTLLVPTLNLEINCEKFSVASGVLTGPTDVEGKLLYEECTALEVTAPLAELPCHVIDEGKLHVTAKALLLPAELKGVTEPLPPAILAEKIEATVKFLSGTGCPLPLESKIKGEVCLKIEGNHTVKPKIVTNATIQAECKERPTLEALTEGAGVKDKLLYGTQEAFVDGTAEVFLGGAAHVGKTIGVLLD